MFIRSRYPWAMAAGLVLASAFPNLNVAGLAWIAPALILLAAIGKPPKQAFRIGYTAGLAHYLASLYWLLLIPVPWTWKWAPTLGWVALSAFLALFPACWVWVCWKLFPAQLSGDISFASIPALAGQFLNVSWAQRLRWNLTCAAIWVAWEMTVARILGGFPWNLLGTSQFRMTPLIQIASFTGVYGVSFLIVWLSLSFLSAGMVIARGPANRQAWMMQTMLPLAVVVAVFLTGWQKIRRHDAGRPELSVALVQPSIPQTMVWDPAGESNRFQELIKVSTAALTNKPDLLVWPEAAVPGVPRFETDISGPISELAAKHKVWMIIGADDAKPLPNATSLRGADFYNSSFLVAPDGGFASEYKKQNLVIFGEYVPLSHVLPFLKYLTPIEGGFTPGNGPVPFLLKQLNVNISVLICFEDVFPHLVREYVTEDTDFLVNLTNNGWFGEGAAQWQHAAGAVFRAVENGVPLVRCSNNGLTCWIDANGNLREHFESASHGIYGPGFMIVRVPLLLPNEKRPPTFYNAHGDVFGWACVAMTVIAWVGRRWVRPGAASQVG